MKRDTVPLHWGGRPEVIITVNCSENCALSLVLSAPSPFPLPPGERVLFPSLDGRGKGRVILAAILNAADYNDRFILERVDTRALCGYLVRSFDLEMEWAPSSG